MFYFLDDHPEKAAKSYATDHLRAALSTAVTIYSDVTRVLIEEFRIYNIEKKMKDPKEVRLTETYFADLERRLCLPVHNLEHPIVQWAAGGQDAWDWLSSYVYQLMREIDDWTEKKTPLETRGIVGLIHLDGPKPVTVGRVYPRMTVFPEPVGSAVDFGRTVSSRDVVTVYRLDYWRRYHNSVQYPQMRRPWWWLKDGPPSLASTRGDR